MRNGRNALYVLLTILVVLAILWLVGVPVRVGR